MLAVINLFIYILKYPTHSTVHSDLALLDIVAGHFGRVHLLTSSQVSFTFPREVAGVASEAVRKAVSRTGEPSKGDNQDAYAPDAPSSDITEDLVSVYSFSISHCKK